MTEVVYYVASSLDGYIATEDGGIDWLMPFQKSGDDFGFVDFYSSVDALLMGSRSYEVALKHGGWQAPDKPSWIFTHRDLTIAHPSVTLTSDDPAQVVETLRARGLKRAWLMGGGELATSFRVQGLISHYIVGLIPVVLGKGIPLFASVSGQTSLKLVEIKPFPSGVVMLSYELEPRKR
jgi:dihydrofolate reductase